MGFLLVLALPSLPGNACSSLGSGTGDAVGGPGRSAPQATPPCAPLLIPGQVGCGPWGSQGILFTEFSASHSHPLSAPQFVNEVGDPKPDLLFSTERPSGQAGDHILPLTRNTSPPTQASPDDPYQAFQMVSHGFYSHPNMGYICRQNSSLPLC